MLTKEGIWNKFLPRALSLGHHNIKNTLIYIDLETALLSRENDEFHVKVAKTVDEACRLAEVGFDYFTTIDDIQIFRMRK